MLESSLAAALHFTIEFAGFVVGVGAAAMVASRPSLLPGRAIGRLTAAAGFLVLAAAEMLHGASFVTVETDAVLVGLRATGWIVVALAVMGASAEGATTSAIVAGGPVLYFPAGAALVAALAAFARTRSVSSNLYRLATAAAITAVGEALVAGFTDGVSGGASEGGLAYAGHGLRLAGSIALATWLWTAARSSVRARFVVAFAVILVVVVLALSTTMTGVISNNIESEGRARVRTQLVAVSRDLEDQKKEVLDVVKGIAASDGIRATVATGRDPASSAEVLSADPAFDLDVVGFLDTSGRTIALAGEGPVVSSGNASSLDLLDRGRLVRSPVVQEIADGAESAVAIDGWKRDDSAVIVILAGEEIVAPGSAGRPAGIAVAGRYLDASTVQEISDRFDPASATLLLDGRVVANGLHRDLHLPAEITSLAPGSIVSRQPLVGGRRFFSAFVGLESVGGHMTLALSSPADIVSDTRRDLTRAMFFAAVVVGALALALAWVSGRRITRPIQRLTVTAQAVGRGDLNARAPVTGDDEIGQLSSTFNDMTAALVRMTQQEQLLRKRIETIIESMADGLVAVDAEGRILTFNVEAELLTGVPAAAARGRPVTQVLDVRDANGEPVELPIEALSEGAVANVYIARSHGAPIPVAITTGVLRDEYNTVTGGVAVIRDMSREHELDKIKGEFLANISHELRTPLTPIKGYAEILSRTGLPEDKQSRFAHGILDSTRRLERIVGLLVDYSAIEAGQLAPQASSVDVASIIDSLATEWSQRAPRHDIQKAIGSNLPRVSGDEGLIRRTLEEVMDNAVKFSPDGGLVRLEARRGRNGTDGKAIVDVSVTDEGIGIMPEDLPAIFSDFHQLDSSETRTYGGLGLGLAFVQRIVQAHQGEVKVESHPDKGTRLTMTLPAVDSDDGS